MKAFLDKERLGKVQPYRLTKFNKYFKKVLFSYIRPTTTMKIVIF